jgi:TetR/AcrR family transcriptional regulator
MFEARHVGVVRSASDRSAGRHPHAEQRLLDAVTEVCARTSYPDTTVEDLLAVAGVSRATFYQYFSSVEDCFLSAYREHASRLVEAIAGSPECAYPELAALEVIVSLAIDRPEVALVLSREGLAAGPAARCERDALLVGIEDAVAAKQRRSQRVDLPHRVLLGGVLRFIATRLTDGPLTWTTGEELADWVRAFTTAGRASWAAFPLPTVTPEVEDARQAVPVAQTSAPRERLLRAAAVVSLGKGYRATTVSDIAATAGVSRRSFYDHFPCKKAAFLESYEFAFAQSLKATVTPFFGSGCWPQRVWDSAQAFTAFFAAEPAFAHLGFVESYALGASLHPRLRDTQLAFTFFLDDGFTRLPAGPPPKSFAQCCALVIFEAGFQATRAGPSRHMRRMQPLAVYVALTPFIGAQAASRFVASQLGRQRPVAAS